MGFTLFREIREAGIAINGKDPHRAFTKHKDDARKRGIGFHFEFEQWWELWRPHWAERGRGALQKCMCRTADKGNYEPGNVRIATNKENHHERALEFRVKHSQRRYGYTERTKFTSTGEAPLDWARGRRAFDEYSEEEETA